MYHPTTEIHSATFVVKGKNCFFISFVI